jgi:hypothetical protein
VDGVRLADVNNDNLMDIATGWVCCQVFKFMEYLNETIRVDNLDTFSYMPIGHAVIMFVLAEVDVAVLVNGSLGVGFDLVLF